VKEILLMQKRAVTGCNIRSRKFLEFTGQFLLEMDHFQWTELAAGKNEFCSRDICVQTQLERNFWTTIRHQIRHQSASPPSSPLLRCLGLFGVPTVSSLAESSLIDHPTQLHPACKGSPLLHLGRIETNFTHARGHEGTNSSALSRYSSN
jgi:hypothetical protein